MLKFIRRLEKTRSFVLLLFAVVMVLSLVLFYAPTNPDVGANLVRSDERAAVVAGQMITVGELARQKESYSRFSQGQKFPTKMILDGLIASRISRVEASRLDLTASNQEVAAEIRRQFAPQDGKPFDQKIYEQNVTAQFGSVSAFEQQIRDDLSAEKLRALITSAVSVSEQEVIEDYQRRNTTFDVSYVSVNALDLAETITPSEEELRSHYEQNKQAYYISSPQKKIRYLFVNTAKMGERLTITEEELRAEYDKLPEERRIAGVTGQEIVLRVAKPEFEGPVFQKASEVITQLRAGGETVSQEAFAEIARGQSENAATARNGGAIPGTVRENPANPTDPYQRLLRMQPGEITEPISYEGRLFILRRGEDVPKTFEMARKELDVSMRNRRAYGAAAELAENATAALRESKDVAAVAKQFAGDANMNAADMVRETPFITPGDTVEGIGVSPQFEEGIAGLENPSDVGEKIPVPEGFAVPLLVERREPRDAEFAEVRDQIIEVVKLEKARGQIEEIANQIAAGADSVNAMSTAAQARNFKMQQSSGFTLGSPLGEGPAASTSQALEDAIYGMKPGEVSRTPIRVGDSWYVVGLTSRQDADMDEFAAQGDQLMDQMLNRKRGEVYANYIASTRRAMEADGRIRIYPDAVAKLDTGGTGIPGL
ncbi:MAG: peptidyl-prolyl cis-trans isomerase [Blastocatellia bacterium]|nr:peptidyl-prolyl cis-trans isomerase [Blastocatellia bacterium]